MLDPTERRLSAGPDAAEPMAADDITALLQAWRLGDQQAGDRIVESLYPSLRGLAAQRLRSADVSLQPTEVVHELYLRLVRTKQPEWSDRGHFLGVAARLIRDLLVDHARRRGSRKRGGDYIRLSLDCARELTGISDEPDLVALDEALGRLSVENPEAVRLIELRFFAGLDADEAAEVVGMSVRTATRRWRFARAWLRQELQQGSGRAD